MDMFGYNYYRIYNMNKSQNENIIISADIQSRYLYINNIVSMLKKKMNYNLKFIFIKNKIVAAYLCV